MGEDARDGKITKGGGRDHPFVEDSRHQDVIPILTEIDEVVLAPDAANSRAEFDRAGSIAFAEDGMCNHSQAV